MEGNKGILIAVVVVAAVVWILFNKASSTVAGVNKNIKQTYTTGTTINAVATSLAPALGAFASNLAARNAPSYTTAQSASDDALFTAASAASAPDAFDPYDPFAGTLLGQEA